MADRFAAKSNLKGVYAVHWGIGLVGCTITFLLCGGAFYLGADAVQGVLNWIPSFVLDGFKVAAYILPAMSAGVVPLLVAPFLAETFGVQAVLFSASCVIAAVGGAFCLARWVAGRKRDAC